MERAIDLCGEVHRLVAELLPLILFVVVGREVVLRHWSKSRTRDKRKPRQ